MKFHVLVTKSFQKDFKKIRDLKFRGRIKIELNKLSTNPYAGKKLKGTSVGQWRIRIGDYRIRYDIGGKEIILHRLRNRREVYR